MTYPAAVTRHPLDPEPVVSTKARAIFALGLAALILGPLVGGVIPGTLALLLSRPAAREQYAAGGFLTGVKWVARGRRLAWIGIVLALAALVVAVIAGLLHLAAQPVQDFDPGTD